MEDHLARGIFHRKEFMQSESPAKPRVVARITAGSTRRDCLLSETREAVAITIRLSEVPHHLVWVCEIPLALHAKPPRQPLC